MATSKCSQTKIFIHKVYTMSDNDLKKVHVLETSDLIRMSRAIDGNKDYRETVVISYGDLCAQILGEVVKAVKVVAKNFS